MDYSNVSVDPHFQLSRYCMSLFTRSGDLNISHSVWHLLLCRLTTFAEYHKYTEAKYCWLVPINYATYRNKRHIIYLSLSLFLHMCFNKRRNQQQKLHSTCMVHNNIITYHNLSHVIMLKNDLHQIFTHSCHQTNILLKTVWYLWIEISGTAILLIYLTYLSLWFFICLVI